jgi:microcystin-dependent protein
MPITINGSGTVTGISAGGLPDGCIVTADIVDNNITEAKIANGAVTQDKISTTVVTVPIGAVFHFAASTTPIGYLKCNGDTVTDGVGTVQSVTANFSALYAVLSSTYGSPGKLPDLRGEFVRGWDDGRGIDSARVFGTAQNASRINTISASSYIADNTENAAVSSETRFSFSGAFSATKSLGEVRPRNIALLACIKY